MSFLLLQRREEDEARHIESRLSWFVSATAEPLQERHLNFRSPTNPAATAPNGTCQPHVALLDFCCASLPPVAAFHTPANSVHWITKIPVLNELLAVAERNTTSRRGPTLAPRLSAAVPRRRSCPGTGQREGRSSASPHSASDSSGREWVWRTRSERR